ncbi:MAG TPA: response regulator transcription factor [Chryseosolibacter sp.]
MIDGLKIGIVDDHKLFRKGLITLIGMVAPKATILFEVDGGMHMKDQITSGAVPDIMIVDVNMPGMDGFETVAWLTKNFPAVKVLVLSMVEKEDAVVKMLKLGVKGYLCKDVEPDELGEALNAIATKGFYYTDYVTGKLIRLLEAGGKAEPDKTLPLLTEREKAFVELACTELTYNEIADKMFLSPKTIDGYRNALFEKLNVKSRVGLVLYAVSNGIVKINHSDVSNAGE